MSQPHPKMLLGDLCDVLDSKRRPITKRDRVTGEYPYYGATGILSYVEDYIFDEPLVLIGEDGAKWGAGENTAFSADGRYWVNNHAHVIRPHRQKLLDAWLIYQLNRADLSEFITGLTVPKLNQARMREIPIIVPPLDEQRRIVAVLDKAFAGIATATANAQKSQTNARALFESYLRSVFDAPNGDWQRSILAKLTSKIGSGATPRGGKDGYKADGTPLIRSMNVHDRYFKDRNLAFIDDNQARLLNNVVVQENDVLLNITGASVARCCLAPEDMAGARVNQHVAIIRTIADKIRPEFLELALTSPHYKDILLGVGEKGGSTRQAITKAEIQTLEVAFPALIDQDSFVDHATELQVETRKLATIVSQKLAALTELKQSLLHKAFAGELT